MSGVLKVQKFSFMNWPEKQNYRTNTGETLDFNLKNEVFTPFKVDKGNHQFGVKLNTFVVSGTPSGLRESDLQSLLENFLEQYKRNLVELDLDKSTNLARSLACSLSARAGKRLYPEEMIHLIDELFSCKVPDVTPDGRKVFNVITVEQVHQLLNR